jgi:ectoine hydroxylase-related dioxygenase (phytanoyl-CoA dioxygenase family)
MTLDVPERPASDYRVEFGPELVADYRSHGFTSVERITTDDELEWLRDVYEGFFGQRRGGVTGAYFDLARPYEAEGDDLLPQVLFPERAVPSLLDSTYLRNARLIAAALLDRDADELEVWGHMIDKPAHTGHETPWHQDEAYWEPNQRFHAVGVWMPLDDCDESNGCMTFVPGSHGSEVLAHRHLNDDPNVHALEFAEPVDVSGAVAVPLAAGGATFHHPRTFHYTGPNRSDRRRRAYASEFQITPQPADRPVVRPWIEETREAMSRRRLD